MQFVKGKKTYIVAAVAVAVGIADGMGYHIPDWAFWVLSAFGFGAMRNGISTDTAKAVGDILGQLTIPGTDLTPKPVEVRNLPPIQPGTYGIKTP